MDKREKTTFEEWAKILLEGNTEPLTDAVVEELVADGWERASLVKAQKKGAVFCRKRQSVLYGGVKTIRV